MYQESLSFFALDFFTSDFVPDLVDFVSLAFFFETDFFLAIKLFYHSIIIRNKTYLNPRSKNHPKKAMAEKLQIK